MLYIYHPSRRCPALAALHPPPGHRHLHCRRGRPSVVSCSCIPCLVSLQIIDLLSCSLVPMNCVCLSCPLPPHAGTYIDAEADPEEVVVDLEAMLQNLNNIGETLATYNQAGTAPNPAAFVIQPCLFGKAEFVTPRQAQPGAARLAVCAVVVCGCACTGGSRANKV